MNIKNILSLVKCFFLAILFVAYCLWTFASLFVFQGVFDNMIADCVAGVLLFVFNLWVLFMPNLAYHAYGDPRSISLRTWTLVTKLAPWFHRFDYKLY